MEKRIKAKFYPEKKDKGNQYFNRLKRLITIGLIVNILAIAIFLLYIFRSDIESLFSKNSISIIHDEQKKDNQSTSKIVHYQSTKTLFENTDNSNTPDSPLTLPKKDSVETDNSID